MNFFSSESPREHVKTEKQYCQGIPLYQFLTHLAAFASHVYLSELYYLLREGVESYSIIMQVYCVSCGF